MFLQDWVKQSFLSNVSAAKGVAVKPTRSFCHWAGLIKEQALPWFPTASHQCPARGVLQEKGRSVFRNLITDDQLPRVNNFKMHCNTCVCIILVHYSTVYTSVSAELVQNRRVKAQQIAQTCSPFSSLERCFLTFPDFGQRISEERAKNTSPFFDFHSVNYFPLLGGRKLYTKALSVCLPFSLILSPLLLLIPVYFSQEDSQYIFFFYSM